MPFIHPPFEALIFLPLTFLPYPVAFVVWNLVGLAMLIVPLALVADHCFGDAQSGKWKLLLPAVPLLISPLWFFLWLRWERVNLMAVFLVWWLFAIMREMLRMRGDVTLAQTGSSLA